MSSLPPVETVGFYSRDRNFNIHKSPPAKLNIKGEVALSEPFRSSLIRLLITADDNEDESQLEGYMQSLLYYIGNDKELLEGIEFVTIRQVLAGVAANRVCERIMAFRKYGIIWIVWYEEPKERLDEDVREEEKDHLARGRAFSKTIVVENKEDTGFQKTVNRVCWPIPGEPDGSVLYSAETDARRQKKDEEKFESVEIKSTTFPFYEFLQIRSQRCFWQCYFGNVKALIVGKLKRVTDEKNVYSIFRLFSHTPESLLTAVRKHWFRWSVDEGMDRVGGLLKALRRLLKEEGDAKVLKQEWIDDVVHWVEDTKAKFDQEFIKQVVMQMEK